MEDDQARKKKWYLDVRHTPCARSALMHGILGGAAVGLLYFLKTSIVLRSCDFAVGGFALITFGSWEVCRLRKAKQRADIKKAVEVLNSMDSRHVRNEPESTTREES